MAFDPDVFAAIFVTLGFATMALTGRFIARRMTKVGLWYDDYLAVLAYISACCWAAVVLLCKAILTHVGHHH